MTEIRNPAHAATMLAQQEHPTCATCKHIGGVSWDTGSRQDHYCGKSAARRRDEMKPTGDLAQDFMDNFRRIFDASARAAACRHYEEAGALGLAEAFLLSLFDADGRAVFTFFSSENRVAESGNKFWERDSYRDLKHGEGRAYKLTELGRVTVIRISNVQPTP